MLRASIESEGGEVDLRGVAGAEDLGDSAIPGAAALVLFAEAVVGSGTSADDAPSAAKAISDARARVAEELGVAASIDAAGIIGNFERMVRIADGTGIPLDTSVAVATSSIREDLGIDRFTAAERTPRARAWHRVMARVGWSVARHFLRRSGRRTSD